MGKWDSDEQRALRRFAVAAKVLVEFDARGYCTAQGHAEAVHKFRYHLLEKSNEKLRTRDSADSYPADWDPMPAGKSVITKQLDPQSPAFQKIVDRLKATVPGAKVDTIEMVQNTLCWDSFSGQKKVLRTKWPNKKPEDLSKYLFHGTGDTAPSKVYSTMNGLDRNFSSRGMWGPGVYLATDAKYSGTSPYVHTRADGKKQLFFAEALTGVSKNTLPDAGIQMPPQLDDQALMDEVTGDTSSLHRYDSVNGTTQSCLVYILYDNFRVYPTYLITYEG
jgi:Poly(ADP-ribose) polymerase catalytic domain